ncbi:MAG TPA: methyltransferase domain-containing protein [Solirubrobacteraceae bacterium]
MTASRDWDASTYDRVSCDVQLVWALELLERLPLTGDEVVLDAGCGSGRVTALLADRVPRGRVYGVDAAPSMVEHARSRMTRTRPNPGSPDAERAEGPRLGERATILCQDLIKLDLPERVDVAFSNATFHWIHDHDALFDALHRSLNPGGRLLAQCGGYGNIDEFRVLADDVAGEQPFAEYFADWRRPWNYANAEDTTARLAAAGFNDVECWLEPRPMTPEDGRAFVRTVCLVRHLDPLPEELRDPFVDRVLGRCGRPLVLEYVRLNMTAVA